jgi:multidrug efflux pump subunit AcrB
VRVRDLGSVVSGTPDRTQLIVGKGQGCGDDRVSLQLGANILTVPARCRGRARGRRHVAAGRPDADQDLRSRRVRRGAIANARDAILIGGFLAVLILFAFLRDFRLTLVAGEHACRSPVLARFS